MPFGKAGRQTRIGKANTGTGLSTWALAFIRGQDRHPRTTRRQSNDNQSRVRPVGTYTLFVLIRLSSKYGPTLERYPLACLVGTDLPTGTRQTAFNGIVWTQLYVE